jgi:hypothetical protein
MVTAAVAMCHPFVVVALGGKRKREGGRGESQRGVSVKRRVWAIAGQQAHEEKLLPTDHPMLYL